MFFADDRNYLDQGEKEKVHEDMCLLKQILKSFIFYWTRKCFPQGHQFGSKHPTGVQISPGPSLEIQKTYRIWNRVSDEKCRCKICSLETIRASSIKVKKKVHEDMSLFKQIKYFFIGSKFAKLEYHITDHTSEEILYVGLEKALWEELKEPFLVNAKE